MFSCQSYEVLKNTFLYRTLRWLFLDFATSIFKNVCKRMGLEKDGLDNLTKTNRSSRQEVLCEKDVLGNFAKFIGKHLCQSLFFKKVAGLKLWHRCFPVNFVTFLRTPFLTEHLW